MGLSVNTRGSQRKEMRRKEKSHLSFLFFSEHARELHIIILNRRNGARTPIQRESQLVTLENMKQPSQQNPLAINLESPRLGGSIDPWLQPWSITGLHP
jgi:hypothetical protein